MKNYSRKWLCTILIQWSDQVQHLILARNHFRFSWWEAMYLMYVKTLVHTKCIFAVVYTQSLKTFANENIHCTQITQVLSFFRKWTCCTDLVTSDSRQHFHLAKWQFQDLKLRCWGLRIINESHTFQAAHIWFLLYRPCLQHITLLHWASHFPRIEMNMI